MLSAAAVLVVSLLAVSRVNAAPAAAGVAITTATAEGSGCPTGTSAITISSDKTTVSVDFQDFIAADGNGVDQEENRKNCQLTLTVTPPAGFSASLSGVDFDTSFSIPSGVNVTQASTTYLQGQLTSSTTSKNVSGPVSGSATIHNTLSGAATGCGAATVVNLNAQALVASPGQLGSFTINSAKNVAFSLRAC